MAQNDIKVLQENSSGFFDEKKLADIAWGLGSPSLSSINRITTDANAVTETGFSVFSTPCTNGPQGVTSGYLQTLMNGYGSSCSQTLIDSNGKIWSRIQIGGVWSSWDSYLSLSKIDTIKGLTGFINGDNIDVSYNYTNRTITLTGDLRYLWRGVEYSLTSPFTSTAHTATNGGWFLYFIDNTNNPYWSQTLWSFDQGMIAYVYYQPSAVNSFAIREVHGLMDYESHKEFHSQIGTYLVSGGKITAGTYIENTATDAANSMGFDAAVIKDEDVITSVPAWNDGTYTTMYIGSGGTPIFNTTATLPFISAGSYIQINNPSTGTLTDGSNGKWYNVYQIIMPCASDIDSQKYRMIMLQPQQEFTSLQSAQAEDIRSLNFGNFANITYESIIYTRITYITKNSDSNTGKCRIDTSGISYVAGSRAGQISIGGLTSNNHASLSNLTWLNSGHLGTANKLAGFDATGLATEITLPSGGFIPYTGATTNVDLGSNSLSSPKIIGGTATNSTITIQPTSANAISGSNILFKTGNNGGTTAMTIDYTGAIGIGDIPQSTASLYINRDLTNTDWNNGFKVNSTINSGATLHYYGFSSKFNINATTSNAAGYIQGFESQVIKNGDYNTGQIIINSTSFGSFGNGNTPSVMMFKSRAGFEGGVTGSITNLYHMFITSPFGSAGTISSSYGMYIEKQKQTFVTNAYGIYQVDASDRNYFGGSIGVGETAPTALIHIKAGTATANTAPLKFTSGTNLTTAETGAMEYDGTNLYFTPTDTTRKTIAYISDLTSSYIPYTGATTSINLGNNSLSLNNIITLPITTSSTTGVIYKSTNRFIHDFAIAGTDGHNVFVGIDAGNFTMTGSTTYFGSYNTGMGHSALKANTTGYDNSAFGWGAMIANTTGLDNTGLGVYALYKNNTGNYNTAVGVSAMKENTSGIQNTAIGINALYNSTTTSYNVAVGRNSGRYLADGSTSNSTPTGSIYLGADTKSSAAGQSNEIVIGRDTIGNGSNTVTIGNTNITQTYLKGWVSINGTTPASALDITIPGTSNGSILLQNDTHIAAMEIWNDTVNFGSYSTTPVVFLIEDAEIARFDINGNLGIKTTTPASELDVNGTITGLAAKFTSGAGLNKIFTSDTDGNGSWVDPSFAPASGSSNYIRNQTTVQAADIHISGTGTFESELIVERDGSGGDVFLKLTDSSVSGKVGSIGVYNGLLRFGQYNVTPDILTINLSSGVVQATSFSGAGTGLTGTASGLSIGGNAATATTVSGTVSGTGTLELVRGNMADNDQFRIMVGGTASNAGYVELATADDGTEPIYVRQYTGVFTTLTRTATLLDGSGNTSFPGSITAGGQAVVTTNDSRLTDQRTPSDGSVTYAKLSNTLKQSATVTSSIDLSANAIGKITLSADTAFSFSGYELNKTYMLIVTANGFTPSFATSARHVLVEGNATLGTSGVFYISLTCIDTTASAELLLTVIMKGA